MLKYIVYCLQGPVLYFPFQGCSLIYFLYDLAVYKSCINFRNIFPCFYLRECSDIWNIFCILLDFYHVPTFSFLAILHVVVILWCSASKCCVIDLTASIVGYANVVFIFCYSAFECSLLIDILCCVPYHLVRLNPCNA